MTQAEMSEMSGQSGMTIVFGESSTVTATFNSLSIGDTDGVYNQQDNNAGWIVLIGTGSNTGVMKTTIPECAIMTIDVATTGANTCSPGDFAGVQIPPYTPYFTFSLTKATINLATPETIDIRATDDPTTGPGSMDLVGRIKPVNVGIDKADMQSTAYLWAH